MLEYSLLLYYSSFAMEKRTRWSVEVDLRNPYLKSDALMVLDGLRRARKNMGRDNSSKFNIEPRRTETILIGPHDADAVADLSERVPKKRIFKTIFEAINNYANDNPNSAVARFRIEDPNDKNSYLYEVDVLEWLTERIKNGDVHIPGIGPKSQEYLASVVNSILSPPEETGAIQEIA
jgi:hypothetical protein